MNEGLDKKSLLVALGYFGAFLFIATGVALFIYVGIYVLPLAISVPLVVGVIVLTAIWTRRNMNKDRAGRSTVRDWTNLEAVREEQRIREEEWLENQQRIKRQLREKD
jgi:hypothetical protein